MTSFSTPADVPVIHPARPVWLAAPLRPGYLAVAKYYRPFLLIQACCLAVVIAYYASVRFRAGFDLLAEWKVWGGLLLSGATAALAGGPFTEVAKAIAMPGRETFRQHARDACFNGGMFFINGMMVDLFYRLQEHVWGAGTDWWTLTIKVLIDQFIFTAFVTTPLAALLYRWRIGGYRTLATLRSLNAPFYRDRVMPLLLPAWFFWIPTVTFIYSMPGPLQYVLFLLALAAWSVLMTFVAGERHGRDVPRAV